MRKFYALKANAIGELLSYRGAVIYHDDPNELEWLFQKGVDLRSLTVVELPRQLGRPLLPLKAHPDMQAVEWPLCKDDFRSDI